MRVFLEPDGKTEASLLNKLWLIVPFDYSALEKLWQDKGPHAVSSFFDKTFQISFNVPTPLLVHWKRYFEKHFKSVLPGAGGEYHDVYRVFEALGPPANGSVTPRQVKLFLNKLFTTHLQWRNRGGMPLGICSVYVLKEKQLRENPMQVVESNFLPREVVELLPRDWPQVLAQLHYSVSKEEAAHILLQTLIPEAITSGDPAKIREAAAIPGFWLVCESQLSAGSSKWTDSNDYAQAAVLLDSVPQPAAD